MSTRPTALAAPSISLDWQTTEPWVRLGMRTLWGMFAGLLLSATLFSIAGAVVASGTVTVETNYKAVQHLDGGIVSRILVKNGDRVAEGDVLIKLDDTALKASHAVVMGRVNDFLIQQARLEAERDGKAAFQVPSGIDAADPAIAKIIASQRSLFDARRTAHVGEESVLTQRVAQLNDEINSLKAQLGSAAKQGRINERELDSVMPLYEKGFVNQQRVAPLQREQARLEGENGRIKAEVAKARSGLSEAELKLAQSEKDFISQVVDELRKVQSGLAEQQEQAKSYADKLARADIRAPRAGRVHALTANTEGGVVTPASVIAQIIPDGDKLIVEAQIPPQEVDKVREQQKAYVRFSAFNARTTPRLEGFVESVSPAQFIDPQTQKTHFTVRVEIPASELRKLGSHELVPGMPAEVYIETTSRSLLSYFLRPLSDVLSRTFRES